ncbi:MAG: AAA family ATPase [Pseudonocardiaceae bacterium]
MQVCRTTWPQPVAAVFGANAFGKSNLLDGLRLMSTLVQGWGSRESDSGIPRRPFRLEPESLLVPSSFAVELVLDGVRYVYGFAVDDERVAGEWLHSYPRGRKRVLFERDGASIDFGDPMVSAFPSFRASEHVRAIAVRH